jgi:hypothetical protein
MNENANTPKIEGYIYSTHDADVPVKAAAELIDDHYQAQLTEKDEVVMEIFGRLKDCVGILSSIDDYLSPESLKELRRDKAYVEEWDEVAYAQVAARIETTRQLRLDYNLLRKEFVQKDEVVKRLTKGLMDYSDHQGDCGSGALGCTCGLSDFNDVLKEQP